MKKIIFIIFITLFIEANNRAINLWQDVHLSPTNESHQQQIKNLFSNNYDNALAKAKRNNKNIFLLITSKNCQWCKKLKRILSSDRLRNKLESSYVAVEADRDRGYYPSNVGVSGVPSIFIINSKNQKIIKSIAGCRDEDYYLKWFEYIDNL